MSKGLRRHHVHEKDIAVSGMEDAPDWLEAEFKLLIVSEWLGRPLVAGSEMALQCHRWPDEIAASLWTEARPVPACFLMPFLVEVYDALSASVLGKTTRNLNGFDNMFHAKASLKGSSWAYRALLELGAA